MRTGQCLLWLVIVIAVPNLCLGQNQYTADEVKAVRDFSVAGISLSSTLADLKERFPDATYKEEKNDIHVATIELEKCQVTATFKGLTMIALDLKGKGTLKSTVAKWEKKFGKAHYVDEFDNLASWTFAAEDLRVSVNEYDAGEVYLTIKVASKYDAYLKGTAAALLNP